MLQQRYFYRGVSRSNVPAREGAIMKLKHGKTFLGAAQVALYLESRDSPKGDNSASRANKSHTNVSGSRVWRTLTSWPGLLSSTCLGRHRPKLPQFPSFCECIQVSRVPGGRNVHENGTELIVVGSWLWYRRQSLSGVKVVGFVDSYVVFVSRFDKTARERGAFGSKANGFFVDGKGSSSSQYANDDEQIVCSERQRVGGVVFVGSGGGGRGCQKYRRPVYIRDAV